MSQNLKLTRNKIKNKLLNLSSQEVATAAQKVTHKIITHKIYKQAQHIACYVPIDNEIDIWAVIKNIWLTGKYCYLPALQPKINRLLQFVKFNEQDQLIKVRYNIPQPKITRKNTIAAHNLDLVIIPLIGFNEHSFRLGRGSGYYDKTFAFKQNNRNTKPYLLGVGYRWQQVKFIPNSWDMVMNEAITP